MAAARPHIAAETLRDLAHDMFGDIDSEPKPESESKSKPCEGFHWIGQPMTACDNCGRPAWEHAGDMATDPDVPFGLKVRPWATGETEAIRRKWDPRYRAQPAAGSVVSGAATQRGRGGIVIYPEIPEPEELAWARSVLRRAEPEQRQKLCAEKGHGTRIDISTFGEQPGSRSICQDCGAEILEAS